MNPGAAIPSLASQLLTPAKLAWVMDVSDRTVDEWTGGRRRKPQIACFKKGRIIRFTPEAVLQFILLHTILPTHRGAVAGAQIPRLPQEQFEALCRRMERLIQACSANAGAQALNGAASSGSEPRATTGENEPLAGRTTGPANSQGGAAPGGLAA